MSDDNLEFDAEIIRAAYAEKVRDAFKVFAENIAVGQSEKSCRDRFLRTLEITRRARDLALEVSNGLDYVEAPTATGGAAAPAGQSTDSGKTLTASEQAIVDQVLAGTTGHRS